ncbi:MAG: SiaB family protein kinase [Bacteroidota bacterium]
MELTDHYNVLLLEEVFVSFKGLGTRKELDQTIEAVDTALSDRGIRGKVKKKLNHIAIEAIQNLHHHALPSFGKDAVLFMIGKDDGDYWVVTGNYLQYKEVEKLEKHIKKVNEACEKGDLKAMYREQLAKGEVSPKGGAGLGIIDMTKRSGYPIKYEFTRPIGNHVFFHMKIKVSA